MALKTSSQIATEVQQDAPMNANEWEMMVRAIEADRAQLEMTRSHVIDVWASLHYEISEADDAVDFVKKLGIVVTG